MNGRNAFIAEQALAITELNNELAVVRGERDAAKVALADRPGIHTCVHCGRQYSGTCDGTGGPTDFYCNQHEFHVSGVCVKAKHVQSSEPVAEEDRASRFADLLVVLEDRGLRGSALKALADSGNLEMAQQIERLPWTGFLSLVAAFDLREAATRAAADEVGNAVFAEGFEKLVESIGETTREVKDLIDLEAATLRTIPQKCGESVADALSRVTVKGWTERTPESLFEDFDGLIYEPPKHRKPLVSEVTVDALVDAILARLDRSAQRAAEQVGR